MTDVAATPRYSGFWRRFGGLIIDGIIVGIISFILRLALSATGLQDNLALLVPQIVVGLIYFAWGWGTGQTVGCMALKMKLVDQNTGAAPGYGKAVIRYIVIEVLSLTVILGLVSYLWMLWDSKKQTLQDKVAGTLVIDA